MHYMQAHLFPRRFTLYAVVFGDPTPGPGLTPSPSQRVAPWGAPCPMPHMPHMPHRQAGFGGSGGYGQWGLVVRVSALVLRSVIATSSRLLQART